jgi:hypothetical protein
MISNLHLTNDRLQNSFPIHKIYKLYNFDFQILYLKNTKIPQKMYQQFEQNSQLKLLNEIYKFESGIKHHKTKPNLISPSFFVTNKVKYVKDRRK